MLLAGPPDTGKTTIGRALASRLKSKFFLIDGTVIAGTYSFYSKVQRIFGAAKRNAPAVVFIDDADLLFEHRESNGSYRYLLTMLDGLESAGAPDTGARAEILRERLRQAPPPLGAADIDAIADASHGLTVRICVPWWKTASFCLEAVAAVRGNGQNYLKRRPAQFIEAREYGFTAE